MMSEESENAEADALLERLQRRRINQQQQAQTNEMRIHYRDYLGEHQTRSHEQITMSASEQAQWNAWVQSHLDHQEKFLLQVCGEALGMMRADLQQDMANGVGALSGRLDDVEARLDLIEQRLDDLEADDGGGGN